ncbi:MAG TPA: sugar ABC transporter permease [Actinomycetes bacterium]|nr:sugar ABC transporter permease [Actinomycetes bacterium]
MRERATKAALERRGRWARRSLILPALVYTILVTQIPFVITIWYSLQSWNLLRPGSRRFAGLSNYSAIFTQTGFRTAVVNTVVFTASAVIISVVLGLVLATLLDRKFLGRGVVRTLLITPFLIMPTAGALLWKTTMLHPVFGIVNFVLKPFGVGSLDWASRFPMATIVIVAVWQWTPFMMIILLSGLQSQPTDIVEAARVDGAGGLAIFRYLTLPHLRPYLELGVLLGSIFILQTFDSIFMITQGGPGQATTNLPYFLYLQAFRRFEIGQAAALAIVVVIGTIVVATVALRVLSNLFKGEELAPR